MWNSIISRVPSARGQPAAGQPKTIQLPASLTAANAFQLISQTATNINWARDTLEWRSSELDPTIVPGAIVTVAGEAGQWRVTTWEWRASGVELALERLAPTAAIGAGTVDAGGTVTPSSLCRYAPGFATSQESFMTSALTLNSTTPRFDLPLLYAAQAQKEVVANEAFALTDALLHCANKGSSATPPATPVDGTNWLVATGASADWAGQDGKLACRQNGNWVFVAPRDGMLVFNRTNGQWQHYSSAWKAPSLPANPTGGSTVDDVARTAIFALIAALQSAGILPGA